MREEHQHRPDGASAEYSYRRRLAPRELLPAVGVGIGAGLAAFYVAWLLRQRTPLTLPGRPRHPTPPVRDRR